MKTESIKLASTFGCHLLNHMGDDMDIVHAARVSTMGADADRREDHAEQLINFLMKNRHGSPFEHGAMTFRIFAPIFVWREFMRHRIGFSYNEQSGRYMELEPVFYVPPVTRALIQVGKPGAYEFVSPNLANADQVRRYEWLVDQLRRSYDLAWYTYQRNLEEGIAKEVARICLPLSIYSTAYVTCNPRSLMSFLSLRTKVEGSTFPSFPQWEINQVANAMETFFIEKWPLTWGAFNSNGRVSP